MSFDNSFTCNMGKVVPTICKELLPRDYIKMKSSAFMRFMPMVAPAMGKINLFSYHFIVRNRDIWTEWDKFITNEDQKKTWQQNQNFVPPEMPYISIYDVFMKLYFLEPEPPFTGVFQDDKLGALRNVYYLVCGVYKDGQNFSFISRQRPWFNNGDIDCQKIFAFVPNRGDYFKGKNLNGLIDSSYEITCENEYYNPFGAGSLFDFLGVNISGFYSHVKDLLFDDSDGFFNDVYALCSTSQRFPNYKPWEYTNKEFSIDYLASLYHIDPSNVQYADITEDWFNNHMIMGFASFDDSNSFGASWYINGLLQTFGTPAVTLDWSTAPFDSANLDLYDFTLSALPLRAYRFVYDEYFRDQNYIEVNLNTDFSRSGNDLDLNQSIDTIWHYLNFEAKSFEHDPYTTALPGPQKGDPVRFLSDAKVTRDMSTTINLSSGDTVMKPVLHGDTMTYTGSSTLGSSAIGREIVVDLSAATIESFRWANAMQKYLERKARTGGRYYEYLLGIWDSKVEDAKLNRPIYLGGARVPVQIGEITQTSSTNVQTGQPLGDLAGRGVAIGKDQNIRFTCPDYGFLLEVCVCVPRTAYGQGIDQKFKRFNYMDYPLPDFAQLGEEAVKKMELYATLRKSVDDSAFGWQSRYYYWKYNRDEVHSSMLTDMKHWNFARLFDSEPYAGKDFLEVNPSYRQFAVTDDSYDHCVVTMWHDITINRALPEFGTPIL